MLSLSYFLGIAVIHLTSYSTEAKRDITIEIMEARYDVLDPKLVKYFNYKVYGRKTIYADIELITNVTAFDVKLNFDVIRKDKTHISLIKLFANGCETLEKATKIKLLNVLLQETLSVSNVPKKCPLLANTVYVFKNFTLKDEDYPNTLPTVNWQLKVDFFVNKKPKGNMTLNGRVRKL